MLKFIWLWVKVKKRIFQLKTTCNLFIFPQKKSMHIQKIEKLFKSLKKEHLNITLLDFNLDVTKFCQNKIGHIVLNTSCYFVVQKLLVHSFSKFGTFPESFESITYSFFNIYFYNLLVIISFRDNVESRVQSWLLIATYCN